MVLKNRPFFKSIRGKIIMLMLLISMIPILIIGIAAYINMSDAQNKVGDSVDESQEQIRDDLDQVRTALGEETIGTQLGRLAYQISFENETWLKNMVHLVNSWADAPDCAELAVDEDDPASINEYLAKQLAMAMYFTMVSVTDKEGNSIAGAHLDVMSMDFDNMDFEGGAMADFVKPGLFMFTPANQSKSETWQLAMQKGYHVTEPVYNAMASTYMIDIAIRFDDSEGKPAGIVIGSLFANPYVLSIAMDSKVKWQQFPPNSRVMMWDGNGNILADTGDFERYMESVGDDGPEWTNTEQHVYDQILANPKGEIPISHVMQDDYIAGYARATTEESSFIMYEDFYGLGWTVMVEQPQVDAFAPLAYLDPDEIVGPLSSLESDLEDDTRNTLVTLIIVIAIVAGFVLFLAYSVSRSISKPIVNLHRGVEEVINGNLEVRVGSEGNDEIGELSRAFDHMTANVKAQQEQLREYNLNLEQMVEERTEELREAHSQLEVYADDLKRSNQELDDFAYIASHDLKEPLRGINNYSSFLLEDYQDKLDEEGQSKLHTLTRLTKRLEDLIDGLLYYSRAGRAELGMQENNTGEIVKGILETLESSLTDQGITVHVAEDMPTVICDQTKVGEVFRNLITNGMKYNDKEDKQIDIGWQKDDKGEPVFLVRDNGIGIKEKDLDKVFKMFTRLHGRDKFGGGTGSGLTLARKIIQRHGGDMWVESEFGKGSTFYFNINQKEEGNESS